MEKVTRMKSQRIGFLNILGQINVNACVTIAVFLLAIFLSVYNLEYYPQIWFDEGWWLQIPKNLVLYGQYAPLSSEGFRPYDTVVSASPVFFLSIAAAFKIGGIGLVQARLVIVAYFLLTCLFVYLISRHLYGTRTALIALLLFILVKPDDEFTAATLIGRMAMAEVPALCFFMAGAYLWMKSFERRTTLFSLLAGVLFGISVTIKGQFLLNVIPVIVILGFIDRLYYRRTRYRHYILPLLAIFSVILFQYIFLFFILGTENFFRYLSELSAASGPQVRVLFSPIAMQTAIKFFFRSDYFIWVVPGLFYSIALCIGWQSDKIKACFVWLFVAVWLTWFLTASVGWARYTFPAMVGSYILVAKLFHDLGGFSDLSISKLRDLLRSNEILTIARMASVLALLVALLLNSSKDLVIGVFSTPNRSAQEFAAYIDSNIGRDELIETWEWEIAFLTTNQTYHHPPTLLLNSLIAAQNLNIPYDPNTYDFQQYKPSYIVVGSFAKWTGLYPAEYLDHKCILVKSVGEYDLYQVRNFQSQ